MKYNIVGRIFILYKEEVSMYTADELRKVSIEELERILKETQLERLLTLEELKSMNVCI